MPNLGAIGSNAIFCEGGDLIGPQAPISATPEDKPLKTSRTPVTTTPKYTFPQRLIIIIIIIIIIITNPFIYLLVTLLDFIGPVQVERHYNDK